MDLFHSCFPSSAFLWLWCALIYFIRSMMLWLQLFNLTLNRHCYKSYWYKGHLVSINCSGRCHVGRNPGTKHISRHIHQDMPWHSATYLLKWHQSAAQETQATRAPFWSSLTHGPTNPDTKHCVQSVRTLRVTSTKQEGLTQQRHSSLLYRRQTVGGRVRSRSLNKESRPCSQQNNPHQAQSAEISTGNGFST